MKRCKRCTLDKTLNEFYPEPRGRLGRTALCIPCCHLRDAEWRAANPIKNSAYQRDWRLANAAHVLTKNQTWRSNNRERSRAFTRKWARANPEKTKAKRIRWNRENRAKVLLYAENRRAREANAHGETTPEQLQSRIDYYGGCCWVCSKPYEAIDHVIPLTRGGTNWPANLRPICKHHNSRKNARPHLDFLRTLAEECAP
jgi:5-methylcytosine-specific restriction endonuclease McrA